MLPNIARQSLIAAFLTLLLTAAAILAHTALPAAAGPTDGATEVDSLLGSYVTRLQGAHPGLVRLGSVLLLFATGIALGRTTVRYALYGAHTYLAIPLFGFCACGIAWTPNYGIACITAFVSILAVRKLYASLRNGYAFDALFTSGFCFGLLPMIHTPALPLVLLFPLGIILFKRSRRECCVALFGLCLPLLTYCYIGWGAGHEFLEPIQRLGEGFMQDAEFDLRTLQPLQAALLGTLLLLLLGAICCHAAQRHVTGMKQRAILRFNVCFATLATLLPLAPCGSMTETAVWAIPAATLLPLLFLRLPAWIANLAYLMLIGGCVAAWVI